MLKKLTLLYLVLFGVNFATSCGGGSSRSGRDEASENPKKNAPPSETPVNPPTPADTPPVSEIPVEELPPIQPDEVKVLETTTQPKITRMNFTASDETSEGRYLSEYLLVLRAGENTCVRLKMRPSTGMSSSISSQILGQKVEGENELETFSCETEQKDKETATENENTETPKPAALTSLSLRQYLQNSDLSQLNFIKGNSSLYLAAPASAALCSQRLFRMETKKEAKIGDAQGLESVVSKTGYLVAVADHIRVWVDAEVGNPCWTGSPDTFDPVKLVLGSLNPTVYKGSFDRLGLDHFNNLASEAEKIYLSLTSTYGAVSDVDQNSKVELFLTPEVNRYYFVEAITDTHDHFQSGIVYKPHDLAVYDSTLNPTSNEAEVVYVWAPDPGGLYKYSIYPTSNSIVSNYIKGYIGQQIMTNILINSHLLLRQGPAEERWLVTGLSLLASSYVAGNDYSINYLAEYLSTRHQYLSLTDSGNEENIPEYYKKRLNYAKPGYQAMFAWYLHTRLCGQSAAMCTELKKLIDTDKVGIANIESVLADTFPLILDNFGSTVGIEMAENPDQARAIWTSKGVANAPLVMPPLQQVRVDSVPQTYEQNKLAQYVQASNNDPAIAGPFPSKESILYQPILPDNDLVISLQKHSVTYILLTGLLAKDTEMSAYLGANLSISMVSLGARSPSSRNIHVEKVSELAHIDQRPVNLTKDKDITKTFYSLPAHSEDFSVTGGKELWILGSIDNFTVNEAGDTVGKQTTIGDIDAFNITVDVCAGRADEAACRSAGGTRPIVIQAIPRDFAKELEPTMLVTTTNLDLYRGRVLLATVDSVESGFIQDENDPNKIGILCESEALYQANPSSPDTSTFGNCANGGLTSALYQSEVCNKKTGACLDANQQSVSYDAYTYDFYRNQTNDPEITGPLFDNLLHSGPDRFPIHTNYTIRYESDIEIIREGARPYLAEEIFRQFFNVKFYKDAKPYEYYFYPVFAGGIINPVEPDFATDLSELDDDSISTLIKLKKFISDQAPVADLTEDCESLGLSSDVCADPHGKWQLLEQDVKTIFSKSKIICQISDFTLVTSNSALDSLCPGRTLTINGSINGDSVNTTSAWIPKARYIIRKSSPISYKLKTYYQPVYPDLAQASDYCRGKAVPRENEICPIQSGKYQDGDIRYQINVPSNKFTHNCAYQQYEKDFLVCADKYSFLLETSETEYEWADFFIKDHFDTDRNWQFGLPIAKRGGEIIGKPHIMHYVVFQVPVAGPVNINLIVGGRQQSQGKYLLRVRTKDF